MANTPLSQVRLQDTWGVASLRQHAGFPYHDLYYAPLGGSLIKWNVEQKQSELIQIHDDLITVLVKSNNKTILTVGFSGEIKIWNEAWTLIHSLQSPTNNVIYGSWSQDGQEFSICSKGPNQMIVTYDLAGFTRKTDGDSLFKWCCKAPRSQDLVEVPNSRKTFDCFNAVLFKTNRDVVAIYQTMNSCELFLISNQGEIVKRSPVNPLGEEKNDMACISSIHLNTVAVGLQQGLFAFYDVDTFEMKAVFQATGSPRVCLWNEDVFVTTSYVSGVMSFWDEKGQLLREVTGGPTGSIVQMNAVDASTYFIGGIMSLHKIVLYDDQPTVETISDVSFLSLTGCGISMNTSQVVATGDFAGNVFFWRPACQTPIHQLSISNSVRCLLWIDDFLLIGCLNSELYCYQSTADKTDNDDSSNNKTIYLVVGDVVAMALDSKQEKLALATTGGYLYMFNIQYAGESKFLKVIETYSVQIHPPKILDDGSSLNMEIWNLAWSPDDQYIATTSEDQTTIISKALTGEAIQTLSGHTTAVTDVDWKILPCGKTILATCADDKTVRVYDGRNFELLHVFTTCDIYGWHTLTYMSIDAKRNRLFVSTQHGYLVSWDLKSFRRVYCRKLHAGSIEGITLSSDHDSLVTIGSDCVVNRVSLV